MIYEGWRTAVLGLLALLMLLPVTLPVTVLRELVLERFGVSELLTSLFMSINMIGAAVAAPLAGALADRFGRRRALIVAALLGDAVCLAGLTLPIPFAAFMALRFAEGCFHIVALSLLLGIAAGSQRPERRGRVMGLVGGGITLGVALGALVGGVVGRDDPLVPLYLGSAVVLVAAAAAWLALVDVEERQARPSLARIVEALRANALLLAPLAFAFVDRFTVGFYTTTFSLYLARIHGLAPPERGILIFCFMLPFSLLSYPFGRLAERSSRVAMVCGGSVVYGVGTALVGWWPIESLALLMVLIGSTAAVMFVPSLVLTTELAPGAIRTTALGAFNAAGSLGFIAGPIAGGLVSESVAASAGWLQGYRAAFVVAGASELACALLALPFLLRLVRTGRTR